MERMEAFQNTEEIEVFPSKYKGLEVVFQRKKDQLRKTNKFKTVKDKQKRPLNKRSEQTRRDEKRQNQIKQAGNENDNRTYQY